MSDSQTEPVGIDKVVPAEKDTAHQTFQNIAFAYAILSDEKRRKRYDATGNTAESLDIDDDGFDWTDFFRAQWKEVVNENSIAAFKRNYQGSNEEKGDILAAYSKKKGSMDKVFEEVMLSNPLDDEERVRACIDAAIESGDVEAYDAYTRESAASKKRRRKKAEKEAKEAEAHLQKLKEKQKTGRKKEAKDSSGGDLAAMIQQRQQSRASTFLDNLEAKYGGDPTTNGGKKGRSKKRKDEEPPEEPPEEAFQKTAERARKRRKSSP